MQSKHEPSRAGTIIGWTSVAIGITELLFPQKIEKLMGLRHGQNTGVLRVLGAREVMHGFDLLVHPNPRPGIVARVAGDLLDGVVLQAMAGKSRNAKGLLTIVAMVAPVVLADALLALKLGGKRRT